ncbi:hypothetical protein HELRODRAFT_175297 [Helobdella robusta]|uniref:Uncharacterized protein n=1 Tax=Helobdella robusta TaxID=6412 RepID=T1F943_HELRO|nr:hypothetical protein HELRODRAFT_175297 [Helobdella robusta]ESO00812.1 hypothetical protein HELRODRAFT_175297 [Helobdella robusta]
MPIIFAAKSDHTFDAFSQMCGKIVKELTVNDLLTAKQRWLYDHHKNKVESKMVRTTIRPYIKRMLSFEDQTEALQMKEMLDLMRDEWIVKLDENEKKFRDFLSLERRYIARHCKSVESGVENEEDVNLIVKFIYNKKLLDYWNRRRLMEFLLNEFHQVKFILLWDIHTKKYAANGSKYIELFKKAAQLDHQIKELEAGEPDTSRSNVERKAQNDRYIYKIQTNRLLYLNHQLNIITTTPRPKRVRLVKMDFFASTNSSRHFVDIQKNLSVPDDLLLLNSFLYFKKILVNIGYSMFRSNRSIVNKANPDAHMVIYETFLTIFKSEGLKSDTVLREMAILRTNETLYTEVMQRVDNMTDKATIREMQEFLIGLESDPSTPVPKLVQKQRDIIREEFELCEEYAKQLSIHRELLWTNSLIDFSLKFSDI